MTPEQQGGDATFRGFAADAIAQALETVAAGQRPQPQPVPQMQPSQASVSQPAPQPQPVSQMQPSQVQAQPQPQQAVVSTDPVADIASRFRTPTTPPPSGDDAPKVDIPPDTPVDAPEEIQSNEKAKSAWEIIRERERQSRHAAEELQRQLEDARRQAGAVADERQKFAEELKGRDDRIRQLEEDLGKLDLAHRPEFRRQYDEPMAEVADEFRSALNAAAELDEEALDDTARKLLTVSDSEFTRLVAQLDSAAQGSLWDKRRRFRELDLARSHAMQEWRSTQDGLAKVDEQEQVARRAQRMAELADSAIAFTQRTMPADQRPSVFGESTYAGDIANADRQFKSFMQVANEEEVARVAYQGFLVPVMQRQVAYLAEALQTMQDAYYRLRGAGAPPSLPVRTRSAPPATPPPPPSPVQDVKGASFSGVVENAMMNVLQAAAPRA